VNIKACAIALLKIFWMKKRRKKKCNFLRWQTDECIVHLFIHSFYTIAMK
jgi:hypothetical protein